MKWEAIVAMARRLDKMEVKDPDLAAILAAEVCKFDKNIREGKRGLPASWKSSAVHMAGYDNGYEEEKA
jgi:hypothetical protein